MKKTALPRVSITAATSKRVRVSGFAPGAMLVPKPEPIPILGYCYQRDHLHVYVNGSMPLRLRTAHEEGRTQDEVWLVASLPAGIQEIDLTDCRDDFRLLLPSKAA